MITIVRGTEPTLIGKMLPCDIKTTDVKRALFTIVQHKKLVLKKEVTLDNVHNELRVDLTKEDTLSLCHDHNYTYWQVLAVLNEDDRDIATIPENMAVEETFDEGGA